ncbi:MAG: exodeoxyribonuclease VII small subunit [Candidatus Omnitrophota bacterium]|jgi:exodeoxyribonuclease VII small subunit
MKVKDMNFEDTMHKLESIVEELEVGDLGLENSLKHYEEGIQLAQTCSKRLEEAKKKIEVLMRDKSGNLVTEKLKPEEKTKKK